jgi:hypothetical protein
MKDPSPERGLAHRHATLRAPTQVVARNRRQQRRAALVNEARSPTCVHLILKPVNLGGATRRPGGETATRREVRSTRGVVDEEQCTCDV